MKSRRYRGGPPRPVKFLFMVLIVAALLSTAVMLLWNQIVVQLFALPSLNFWEAAGLLLLCRILFGRFGGPPWSRGGRSHHWKERWKQMSDEDRQRLRDRWKERCRPGTEEKKIEKS